MGAFALRSEQFEVGERPPRRHPEALRERRIAPRNRGGQLVEVETKSGGEDFEERTADLIRRGGVEAASRQQEKKRLPHFCGQGGVRARPDAKGRFKTSE